MKLVSIITGDLIGSRKRKTDLWADGLRNILEKKGEFPVSWEIYRGDEFQLEIAPEDALMTSFEIRAFMRSLDLDARISIGIGDKSYSADKITESNGSAFLHSGELFEKLKSLKMTLGVNSGNGTFDETINLMLRLATPIISGWLPQQAEYVLAAIQNPDLLQEEIGQQLDINQAAVSGRRKRSQFELLTELDSYYRKQIKATFP